MNATEMLCHLRGAFTGAMGELQRWAEPPPQPLPPRPLKLLALRVPLRWPRNVETVGELKLGAPAMCHGGFADELRGLEMAIERFVLPSQARGEHPMFGPMTYWDWMRWGYLHTDHHLRQFGR